jgi:flavodoxin
MAEGKILIVYYSRTGTTRKLAEAVQREMGGELLEVKTQRYQSGLRGYLLAGLDSILNREIPIQGGVPRKSGYDLVILGSPVWNRSLSAPMRTFMAQTPPKGRHFAHFLTYGGSGSSRAFEQLERLSRTPPEAKLAVTSEEIHDRRYLPKLHEFVRRLAKVQLRRAA